VPSWVVMRKKKLKKQSGEALLSEVRKEMKQPRAAASTRSEVSGGHLSGMFPTPKDTKTKEPPARRWSSKAK
jgi:hypothetical protein